MYRASIKDTNSSLSSEQKAYRSGWLKKYDEDKTAYMASKAKAESPEAYEAFKAKQKDFRKSVAEKRNDRKNTNGGN